MPERELEELVSALRDVIRPVLRRSESSRRLIRALGALLVAEADREGTPAGEPGPEKTPAAPSQPAPPEPGPPLISGPRTVTPRPANEVPLRLGDATARVHVFGRPEEVARARSAAARVEPEAGSAPITEPPLDLGLISLRCRLKSEGCRVFIERRAAAGENGREAGLIAQIDALVQRARELPDCFLWMVFPGREQPDDEALGQIARWYDALGDAASLAATIQASPGSRRADLAEAMQLLAHADAGLRVALQASWLTKPDSDQDQAYHWLRRETNARRILVHDHMRLDDPPDPESAGELRERIAALRAAVEEQARRALEADRHLKRLRYHAGQIAAERSFDPSHDWRIIESALAELAPLGLPHTSERVGAALDALVEAGAGADPAFPRAVAAIAAAREALRATDERPGAEPRAWSARVHEVRALLAGTGVVVIGGERRADAIERFREAFDLAHVEWVELAEHGSGAAMRAPIQRPDTALVLVLVKLAGHLHVDEAREYAREAAKPVVLLRAGYNPEQVAFAILGQVSEQLRPVE